MTKLEYVELRPNSQDSFSAEKKWRQEAFSTWRCRCGYPKPDVHGPIDVVVANPRRKMPVDFVFGFSGFGIISTALLHKLGSEQMESLFHLGKVHAADGQVVQGYKTFRAKDGVIYVRGSEHSPRRFCPNCGRLIYHATRDAYLCGLERMDVVMQTASIGNLLIRSDFFESTLSGYPLPHVKLRRLEVRESASDGLPTSIEEAIRVLRKRKTEGHK